MFIDEETKTKGFRRNQMFIDKETKTKLIQRQESTFENKLYSFRSLFM